MEDNTKSNLIKKWKEVTAWLKKNSEEKYNDFNVAADPMLIKKIEQLTVEPFPDELRLMYSLHDGETGENCGTFFGCGYMSLKESIDIIEFGNNLVKPANRIIDNPIKSNELIDKILNFYRKQISNPVWFKLEFSCSANSFGGPYLYSTDKTTSKERTIIRIEYDKNKELGETVKQLYELEKPGYNWDELEFVLYHDGKYNLIRKDYDFNNEINFTSFPEGAIKKNYFNPKWIPVFHDGGGNYIGIDLDPGVNGKKGQVIIFGRDEQDMTVVADNMEGLFDLCLSEINKKENPEEVSLLEESHIHVILRDLTIG